MRSHALRVLRTLPLLATAALAPAQTLHLIPQPREVKPGASLPLTQGIRLSCDLSDPETQFAVQDFQQFLAERHIPLASGNAGVHICVLPFTTNMGKSAYSAAFPASDASKPIQMPPPMHDEGYVLAPDAQGLNAVAATPTGTFYALQTVKQLIQGDGPDAVLHLATIRDYPTLKYRGLQDDLSRGPVSTLDYQKKLIRTLAAYKANVYSPYFEHTQQYASNPLPAPPGGSVSAADARELTAYAARYHITVIPDQEAFGHLHHNLNWETYSQLAETPHGAVLAPGQPGSLQLIDQMFTELAADYPGPFLHIGADETVDLGHGQTKAAVEQQGLAPVYLNYLQQIDKSLRPLHRRILFWGDIAQDAPALVKALPPDFKQNTIAVAWWYNPSKTGYARYITPFTDAGIETWVASGINNWSRVYPNYNYALANIQGFTRDGVKLGATGQLNTIWYDDGEALASNNYFGILFGAAQAWQGGTGSPADFEAAYGPIFHGDATGKINQAQEEIMAAQALLHDQAKTGDASDGLFWLDPWSKDGQTYAAKLRPYTHDLRLHAERALTLIAQARAAYPGAPSSRPTGAKVGYLTTEPGTSPPYNPDTPLTTDNAQRTTLREPDALDALELGARRIDFIGLKFQLADEIPTLYAQAQTNALSSDKKVRADVIWDLSTIRGINGRLEDIVDTYSLLRDLYAGLWLRTNRPYALRPVLEHYDSTINLWYTRIDRFHTAQRQWDDSKTLPSPTDLGLPPIPPPATSH